MATAAILVNGLPASGKSTLAAKLAALLGCPVLSTDALKQSFADLTGETVAGAALDGIAMDAAWSLAARIPDGVVVESFWFSGRDDELLRAGVQRSGASRVVEVWCQVPREIAEARFQQRQEQREEQRRARGEHHGIHPGWITDWAGAQPIGVWPVVRVDTSAPTDFDTLMPELASHLLG